MAWKPQKKKKENANEFTVWTWRSNNVMVELKFQFNIVFENAEHVESQSEIKGKNEILKIGKRRKENKRLERWLIYQWDEDEYLKRMKAWEWFSPASIVYIERERERVYIWVGFGFLAFGSSSSSRWSFILFVVQSVLVD